jgi:hypothetical protein
MHGGDLNVASVYVYVWAVGRVSFFNEKKSKQLNFKNPISYPTPGKRLVLGSLGERVSLAPTEAEKKVCQRLVDQVSSLR